MYKSMICSHILFFLFIPFTRGLFLSIAVQFAEGSIDGLLIIKHVDDGMLETDLKVALFDSYSFLFLYIFHCFQLNFTGR